MNPNGHFKSLPTFDAICRRLNEMESCVAAQGNVIEYLLTELQEREYEITFLMNLSHVSIPTSKIAGADGKIPVIRKSARDVYKEGARALIVEMFRARAQAEQDAQNLSSAADAPQESTPATEDRKDPGPTEFSITGKVTH